MAGRLTFGIEAGGRLIGDVLGRQPASALPPGVSEVGIDLYGEGDRGLGYGSEAVTFLEKPGFIEEGVMRGFMPRDGGGRDDYVLDARLRD
ncbi:MAG: hypothetical protein ABR569_14685 [Gaiellaceae bacterium]